MIQLPPGTQDAYGSKVSRETLLNRVLADQLNSLVARLMSRGEDGRFARLALRKWFEDKARSQPTTTAISFGEDDESDGQVNGPREEAARETLFRHLATMDTGGSGRPATVSGAIHTALCVFDVESIAELCDVTRSQLVIARDGSAKKQLETYVGKVMDLANALADSQNRDESKRNGQADTTDDKGEPVVTDAIQGY
jgi:hypothetical protein